MRFRDRVPYFSLIVVIIAALAPEPAAASVSECPVLELVGCEEVCPGDVAAVCKDDCEGMAGCVYVSSVCEPNACANTGHPAQVTCTCADGEGSGGTEPCSNPPCF